MGSHRSILGQTNNNQGNNKLKSILTSIRQIEFGQLTLIDVSSNNIESIEGFSRIYMPFLKALWINKNKIVFMRDLRKAILPKLQKFRIYGNQIKELKMMSELSSPINWAAVQLWGDGIQDNNIVWILRVQTPVLESFEIKNERRIKQRRIQTAIRNKFKQINIHTLN